MRRGGCPAQHGDGQGAEATSAASTESAAARSWPDGTTPWAIAARTGFASTRPPPPGAALPVGYVIDHIDNAGRAERTGTGRKGRSDPTCRRPAGGTRPPAPPFAPPQRRAAASSYAGRRRGGPVENDGAIGRVSVPRREHARRLLPFAPRRPPPGCPTASGTPPRRCARCAARPGQTAGGPGWTSSHSCCMEPASRTTFESQRARNVTYAVLPSASSGRTASPSSVSRRHACS